MLTQPSSPSAPGPTPTAYILPRGLPRSPFLDRLFIYLGIAVSALIAVSLIAFHAIYLMSPGCLGFSCPSPPPLTGRQLIALVLGWVFVVGMDLAVALSVSVAFLVGGTQNNLPDSTKRGVSLFSIVFLAVWLLFSASFMSSLVYLLRTIQ